MLRVLLDRRPRAELARRLYVDGDVRALAALQQLVNSHRESKNANRHLLTLADLSIPQLFLVMALILARVAPTVVLTPFLAGKLAPDLLGAIAVAAYSYTNIAP